MKRKSSINDDMRSRFFRSSIAFVGFALIYLAGSALLNYLTGDPWEPNSFVLVAYVVGDLILVLLPGIKNSDDCQA
ncbi:hypothetical protein EUU23_10375 [Sphingorhabdus sp. IMCC26285]|uniref:Uncharacterized protein n=1 Tax=Sphingorhabdus profundilacus TaxID=2509718 RepID=A0A6I4LX27_9SPHN|nr:hypothetical protein [Sphingorhabdus profundilacus]